MYTCITDMGLIVVGIVDDYCTLLASDKDLKLYKCLPQPKICTRLSVMVRETYVLRTCVQGSF